MDKLRSPKKIVFVVLAALAIVLAVNAPSQARGMGGRGFGGGHPGGVLSSSALASTDTVASMLLDGRHFDRGVRGGFGGSTLNPVLPYDSPATPTLLLVLPELRGVLPERGDLPGHLGAGPGFMTPAPSVTALVSERRSARSPRAARHYSASRAIASDVAMISTPSPRLTTRPVTPPTGSTSPRRGFPPDGR